VPQLPDTYRAVVLEQQRQLQRLINENGIGPVRRLYQDMLESVTKKLGETAKGTFTATQLRGMLAQIKLGLAGVLRDMSTQVGDASFRVGLASARQMLQDVAKLEKQFTGVLVPLPLLESARLAGLVKDSTSSLMRIHETSMAAYGTHLVGTFEKQMAASLAAGESSTETIDRIQRAGDLEWYRAERIVRTELSFASSASARAAMDEQADELDGDLWTRWSEHVSDSGTPLDDRVGVDSEAMHGQVAPPGGLFTQPPRSPDGEEVSDSLALKTWSHPPNRPNDRAVLTPWRAHWGVPGWVWKGKRTPVTEAMVHAVNTGYVHKRAPAQAPHVARPAPAAAAPSSPPPAPAGMPQQAQPRSTMSQEYRDQLGQLPAELQHQVHALPLDHQIQIAKMVDEGADIEEALPKYGVAATPPKPLEELGGTPVIPEPEPLPPPPIVVDAPKKNPRRVEAAKKAAEASAERRREIHSAVKSNLPQELQVAWEREGHKFMQQQAARIRGVKDRINASSKLSEAFAEQYGSGQETAFGNEGDRFFKRAEIEAQHAETWADEQERKYYEEAQAAALRDGEIDENGELTELGRSRQAEHQDWGRPDNATDDDPPF